VSVVGFDNQELISDSLRPGLTTVGLPHYEMGKWAVKTLLEQVESEPPYQLAHALMACPIIRRDSVAAPPMDIRTASMQPNGFPYRPGGEPRAP
jgi:LacI family transcriptional regulator